MFAKEIRWLGILAVATAVILTKSGHNLDVVEDLKRIIKSLITNDCFIYPNAAVSADHNICSEYGSRMLEKGGNAVDAAISAMLCTGVVNGHSVSVGGGHFMVIFNKEKDVVEVVDARDRAPAAAHQNMFVNQSMTGGLRISVPGDISGYWLAHQRHGKLPWKELFQPAIKLATEGVPLSRATAIATRTIRFRKVVLPNSPLLRQLLHGPNGKLYEEGDLFVRPKYAKTLQILSEGSDRTFYEGPLAQDIVADIQDEGGIITMDDMKQYMAILKKPIKTMLGNYSVYTTPPPSDGVIMALILNILKGYSIQKDDLKDWNKTLLWHHRVIEALRFAYANGEQIGDNQPCDEVLDILASDEHASYLRSWIDDKHTHDPSYYGGSRQTFEDSGTSHVSVIDQYGNSVALTSTIDQYFGSGVYGSRTGIIFNNQMDNFNYLTEKSKNFVRPGKRPRSSMCPAIILDENHDVKMTIGSAGGRRIGTTNAKIIFDTLVLGKDLPSVLNQPRFHLDVSSNTILHETHMDRELVKSLNTTFGHAFKVDPVKIYSVVMALLRKEGQLVSYPEYRKGDTLPAGF